MSWLRRFAAVLLAAVCFLMSPATSSAVGTRPAAPPPSAVLMDTNSGIVLFDQRLHDRRPMASTTKIMTALVTLESAKLDDTVTATETCTKVEGSCLALQPGERVRLDDLLAALLLKSANDGEVAIAEHISGSVEAFVARMNQRARELGAKDTHFANPNGLYDPNHYSSAYDLALITREAMKHPRFRELVSSKTVDIWRPGLNLTERMINHNKLLWREATVDGVKTGYVKESGHCLVASATRNEWQLIAVTLGAASAQDAYSNCQNLLEYGFAKFRQQVFCRRGDAVGQARVASGAARATPAVCQYPLSTVLGPGLPTGARLEVKTKALRAPVRVGEAAGEARVVCNGRVLARAPLLAAEAVPKSRLVVVGVWTMRTVGLLALAAVLVRTNAKIVKAYRRRGRRLPPQGRGPDPRGAGVGGRADGGSSRDVGG